MGLIYIALSPLQNYAIAVPIEKFIVILEVISIVLNISGILLIKYIFDN